MSVKSSKIKVQKSKVVDKKAVVATPDLIRGKQSSSDTVKTKIATSPSVPRNDKKVAVHGASLSVPVYSLAGKETGTLALPKEIFGAKVNQSLLSQAVRVYATNQKSQTGSTKTRGEVEGSTAKIYRQKGTGRARHGAVRAPIFVGGGITFGPKPRKTRLGLPQSMKRAALISALSAKSNDKVILGISGIEKASGKTKEISSLLNKLKVSNALIVTGEKPGKVIQAVKNIPSVDISSASLINAYEVLKHNFLILTKEAINVILGSETTPESGEKDFGRAPLARMTIKKVEAK